MIVTVTKKNKIKKRNASIHDDDGFTFRTLSNVELTGHSN